MSRGMVSFLAGMGAGYIKAKDKALEQERQAKIDARADWEHQRKVDAATKEDAVNAEMATAMNPVATGSLVTDSAGSNAFTKDADAAAMLADMAGAKNDGVMTQHATRVAGTAYTDPAKAAEATKLAMTPDAESQRVQDVYRRNGMRDKAMQEFTANEAYKKAIKERMTTMETEGVTAALGLLKAGAPEQAMEAFQKSGSVKLPEGSKFVQVDGTNMWTGQPGKVWSAVGPDGKTIVADVGQVTAKYLGLDGIIKQEADLAKSKQTQANADREYELEKDEKGARAEYYRSAAGAKENTPPKSAYERMDEFDRQVLSGIQEDRKQIRGAILKAEAEGTTNPEGVRKLEAQLAALSLRERKIQAKYATQAPADDPAGMRRPSPAPSGSPAGTSRVVVSAETQRARDSDRVAILQSELASAKARLASGDQSAAADVEALTRELGRAEKTPAARPAPAPASAPTPPAQPRQQATMSRPEPPAPPPAAQPGATISMGDYMKNLTSAFSGNSQAQINGIKQKLANGLALSGTEQAIAMQAGLIRAR